MSSTRWEDSHAGSSPALRPNILVMAAGHAQQSAIRDVLCREPFLTRAQMVGDFQSFERAVRKTTPDIVIFGPDVATLDVLAAYVLVVTIAPGVPAILCAEQPNQSLPVKGLRMVPWSHRHDQLTAEVLQALQCKVSIRGGMTGDISAKSRDTHRAVLSRRQIEVLRLAGCGLTAREIAAELRIATTTVERHLADINVKLGTRKRQDAVELAVRMGWFLPTSIPLSASQSGSHEELDEPPPLPAE